MDNTTHYKQQLYFNTCSDAEDSTSFSSFPWFPENNRRRKSRLGTHRNQIRHVFQETTSNDGDHSSSNKENIDDRSSNNTTPPDAATGEIQTEERKLSTYNNDLETSTFSCTNSKFNNQSSPFLSIPRIFDDGLSPLATSFEKSKTVPSSFPSFLAEDEIDGILREMNSRDNVGTPRFPLSPSSNKTQTSILMLEKSSDASVSSVIANQFQTAETKLNKSFSGKLPNDVSYIPAGEDLGWAPSEQTNNSGLVVEYLDSNCLNSFDQRNSSIRCSNSTTSMELSAHSVSQPVTESSGLPLVNSNSAVPNLDFKNSMESSCSLSLKPIIENCGLDCTNSIKLTSISLQTRNQFSEPAHTSQLPIDLSSMQDQENAVDSQISNKTNFIFPLDLSPRHDQENYPNFQNPNINPKLPIDLSSRQDHYKYASFQNPDKKNSTLPIDLSAIRDQETALNVKSPEFSSNPPSKEIRNNIELDEVLSLTEPKTESVSITSVIEIPSIVKLQRTSISASVVDKNFGPLAINDLNLEQRKPSAGELEILPSNTAERVPPSEAPKPTVQFAEPAVVREFSVPRNSNKIPAAISVKGKSYTVLNILGSGGSSVVYQVSDPETNELLALKKVKLPDEDDEITDGYLNEVQMLENLQNCDVIIKIFDHQLVYKNGKKTLHVVMEKGDTDLSSLIKSVNESKKLSIPMIIYYWTEMLAAVNEVHRRGIIHSDLKPANFVLVRGRLKLIDFGIASSIQGDVTSVYKDYFCGTLNYMSPEATSYVRSPSGGAGYKITFKTDVWSLGCILYNLVYGRLPFHHIRKRIEKIHAIISPTMNVEFPEKKDVPPILISLLKSCLEKDYKQRPTVQELLDRTMRIFQCSSVD